MLLRPSRRAFFWSGQLACLIALSLGGCQKLSLLRSQTPDKDEDAFAEDDKAPKPEYIGDYVSVAGNTVMVVHGVGLVIGLQNTGEDPPPSTYRTELVKEMQKAGVKNPNEILASPTTALVQVTAYLTVDIRKGDPFDVEVRLPPGSEATSLAGGWLMECRLAERAIIPGEGEKTGSVVGKAKGPILISAQDGDATSLAGVLKRGRVLGGGVAMEERNLGLYLRSDFRSVRNSNRIAGRVGQRFHDYDRGMKKPLAEAKTDQYVTLKVHPRYKDNYPRYMQAVRSITFRETPVQQRDRIEKLKAKLHVPETAAAAAIELEGVGIDAIPALKSGLTDPSAEVRFYAAEALAYLGEEDCAEQLYMAARDERAFRVFAIAALSALDEPSSFQHLRQLLDEPSAETRYGAFRGLWTLDKNDPFIRGQELNGQFHLHILDTQGEPMVHLTRHRLAEVVLFGADQRFSTPLALTAGKAININAQPGSNSIVVSRYDVSAPDRRKEVSTRVSDVILAAAEMGASYPDIAQMLSQAASQYNLPGKLEMDALPQAGRTYYRPGPEGAPEQKKGARVGRNGVVPNLFPAVEESGEPTEDAPEAGEASSGTGEASHTDIRNDEPETEKDAKPKSSFALPNPFKKKELYQQREPKAAGYEIE